MKVTNPMAGKYANPQITANYAMGLRALKFEQFDEAETRFRTVLSLDPTHVDAQCLLGEVYEKSGQADKAKEQFLIALKLDPRSADAHMKLGIMMGDSRDFTGAVFHLEQAVSAAPSDAFGHFNLALALLELGRVGDAETSLLRAKSLTDDPSMRTAVDTLIARISRR
jgi:Flp pilus assembly protein TadD